MINVNCTTANYPGKTHSYAIAMSLKLESSWANIVHEDVQLCPQQIDQLTPQVAEKLREKYNQIQLRCHANVRLFEKIFVFDAASDLNEEINKRYIQKLNDINNILKSQVYSFHAGRKVQSLEKMKTNVLKLQDILKIEVAVEGLYPSDREDWNINSWREYEWLLNSDLKMAIDLSHLQIVANKENNKNEELIKELITSKNCLEVHVAGNDKERDNHQKVKGNEYWIKLLEKNVINGKIFTEENQNSKIKY